MEWDLGNVLLSGVVGLTVLVGLFLFGRSLVPRRPNSYLRADSSWRADNERNSSKGPMPLPPRFPEANESPFRVLGLPETAPLTAEALQAAARRCLQDYHPDRFAKSPADIQTRAQQATQQVLLARAELARRFNLKI